MWYLNNANITLSFETSFTAITQSHSYFWTEIHLGEGRDKHPFHLLECNLLNLQKVIIEWNISKNISDSRWFYIGVSHVKSPTIYLTVAQKPLLLIQVCESWIELSNIKSLNVNTHVSTRKQAKSTRAQGWESILFGQYTSYCRQFL